MGTRTEKPCSAVFQNPIEHNQIPKESNNSSAVWTFRRTLMGFLQYGKSLSWDCALIRKIQRNVPLP